jgi:hypothetical protein
MPGNLLIRALAEREHTSGTSDAIDCIQSQPWQHSWRMTRYDYARTHLAGPGLLPAVLGTLPRRASALLRRIPGLRPLVRSLRGT